VYPDASPSSAKTSASALLSTHNHIKDRALELLANTKGLRLEDIIGGLKDDLSATKVVYFDPATKEKHLHADYASIHKARQFVFKLYGLGNDSINISQDNRSVTVNTGDPATVERLEGATSKLERLHAKLEAERKGKAVWYYIGIIIGTGRNDLTVVVFLTGEFGGGGYAVGLCVYLQTYLQIQTKPVKSSKQSVLLMITMITQEAKA